MQATAVAQPNIALIKYWGKRDLSRNLPAVGSISITLRDLFTRMHVRFDDSLAGDLLTVNGAPDERMQRVRSACSGSQRGVWRDPRARPASVRNATKPPLARARGDTVVCRLRTAYSIPPWQARSFR